MSDRSWQLLIQIVGGMVATVLGALVLARCFAGGGDTGDIASAGSTAPSSTVEPPPGAAGFTTTIGPGATEVVDTSPPVTTATTRATTTTTRRPTTTTATTRPTTTVPPVQSPTIPSTVRLARSSSNRVVAQDKVSLGTEVRINGTTFPYGAYTSVCCSATQVYEASIDFDLSRSYALFTARLGVRDDTTGTGSVQIRVVGDGRDLYTRSFALGQSEDVALPVTDVLRLRILVSGPLYTVRAAIGDPTVTT